LVASAVGLALGLFASHAAAWIVSPAATAILGERTGHQPLKLALWHGLTPALALSAGSILLGALVYANWDRIRRINRRSDVLLAHGPAWWYDLALGGLNRFASAQTRLLQTGYLRHYLLVILATTVGLSGYVLISSVELSTGSVGPEIRFYEAALAGLLLLAALATVLSRTRLAAVAALGVVGYGVALVFILFGAPDLAMTQFAIETLTVILLVLVLYRLPRYAVLSSRWVRIRDAAVALVTGATVTALVLAEIHGPAREPISRYYAEQSVAGAHGRNIVNVILVDFRALDTLGEITVLAVAAIGVYALLKLSPKDREDAT
jgi:multicomponent Na+:H+ antiporter subunit A